MKRVETTFGLVDESGDGSAVFVGQVSELAAKLRQLGGVALVELGRVPAEVFLFDAVARQQRLDRVQQLALACLIGPNNGGHVGLQRDAHEREELLVLAEQVPRVWVGIVATLAQVIEVE